MKKRNRIKDIIDQVVMSDKHENLFEAIDSYSKKNVRKYNFIWILSLLFVILLSCFVIDSMDTKIVYLKLKEKQLSRAKENHSIPFSEESLIELLKDTNIKYPYIVLAQAKMESGNYTSNIFKENNNLFGMKCAKIRITTSLGTKNGHAYYRDWVDCVYDYAMFQSAIMCEVQTESEYFDKLRDRYAEDSTYVSSLINMINKQDLKKYFKE